MATIEIRKIDIESAAKVCGLVSAMVGLIEGVLIAIVGAFAALTTPFLGGFVAGAGLAALILLPILYGVAGLIAGIVGALLYNFSADNLGGIKYTTK